VLISLFSLTNDFVDLSLLFGDFTSSSASLGFSFFLLLSMSASTLGSSGLRFTYSHLEVFVRFVSLTLDLFGFTASSSLFSSELSRNEMLKSFMSLTLESSDLFVVSMLLLLSSKSLGSSGLRSTFPNFEMFQRFVSLTLDFLSHFLSIFLGLVGLLFGNLLSVGSFLGCSCFRFTFSDLEVLESFMSLTLEGLDHSLSSSLGFGVLLFGNLASDGGSLVGLQSRLDLSHSEVFDSLVS